MFTASAEQEHIYEALEAGADGYCLKLLAGEHLYAAIKAVTSGATWLIQVSLINYLRHKISNIALNLVP